jgi:hypothetical protein
VIAKFEVELLLESLKGGGKKRMERQADMERKESRGMKVELL